MTEVNKYLFEYWYEGDEYGFEIPASSQNEAESRVKVISNRARLRGEIKAKIYIPTLIERLLSAFSRSHVFISRNDTRLSDKAARLKIEIADQRAQIDELREHRRESSEFLAFYKGFLDERDARIAELEAIIVSAADDLPNNRVQKAFDNLWSQAELIRAARAA